MYEASNIINRNPNSGHDSKNIIKQDSPSLTKREDMSSERWMVHHLLAVVLNES